MHLTSCIAAAGVAKIPLTRSPFSPLLPFPITYIIKVVGVAAATVLSCCHILIAFIL